LDGLKGRFFRARIFFKSFPQGSSSFVLFFVILRLLLPRGGKSSFFTDISLPCFSYDEKKHSNASAAARCIFKTLDQSASAFAIKSRANVPHALSVSGSGYPSRRTGITSLGRSILSAFGNGENRTLDTGENGSQLRENRYKI
jgi:hypothetical protein